MCWFPHHSPLAERAPGHQIKTHVQSTAGGISDMSSTASPLSTTGTHSPDAKPYLGTEGTRILYALLEGVDAELLSLVRRVQPGGLCPKM